jgi:hypothetical protein
MTRRLAIAAVLFLAVSARAQTHGPVDWIFLVDTSKSMLKNDVFGEVKKSLKTFAGEAAPGDSVAILTFDRDARLQTSTPVAANRDDLYTIIDELRATGDRTHLGAAIAKGLDRVVADPNRTPAIVLFTDGKEDVRGIPNPTPIDANVTRAKTLKPWMFFVSMDEHEEKLREFTGARFIEANDAAAIRKIARDIRKTIEDAKPAILTISPAALNFGESRERILTIASDKRVRLSVTASGVAMQPHENVIVNPGTPVRLPLKLSIPKDAAPGTKSFRIDIRNAGSLNGSLLIPEPPPSPYRRIAIAVVAMAFLLLLAFLARNHWRKRNELEGELEIVKPRIDSSSAFVGLPALKKTELVLSSIVPADALAGSDARLVCRHRNGEKKVWISAAGGSLRVNDIEVPSTELYDADTIQIGDAKLRFNRVGHERPQEDRP